MCVRIREVILEDGFVKICFVILSNVEELAESLRLLNIDNKLETHQLFCDNLDRLSLVLSRIIGD